MNIIVWLEFHLSYDDFTVQQVWLNARGMPSELLEHVEVTALMGRINNNNNNIYGSAALASV